MTLTPTPMTTFAGWSGDCVGLGACEVTMDRARHVIEQFSLEPVVPAAHPASIAEAVERDAQPLTVETAGTGAGRVTATVLEAR